MTRRLTALAATLLAGAIQFAPPQAAADAGDQYEATISVLGGADAMRGRDYEGPQVVPLGVLRVGWEPGVDCSNVQVAVLDTGVDAHSDLNLVGGVDFTDDSPDVGWGNDEVGHGTWLAGRIGAHYDDDYVTGICPGAAIWSVKVLNGEGIGQDDWITAGYRWLAEHADVIDIANLSFGGRNGPPGAAGEDEMHDAFVAAVDAGVVMVTAAGNDGEDAANFSPANYPEGVTVGAFTDTDGQPGGAAPAQLLLHDDAFVHFSNDGTVVDLLAPGVNETSLLPNEQIGDASGTSMAAPAVVGVIAADMATSDRRGQDSVNAVVAYSAAQDDEILGWPAAGMFAVTPPAVRFRP